MQAASDDTCRERLAKTKAKFRALADRDRPNARGCGMPHGVGLIRGQSGLRYRPPLQVDCSFALKLGEIEALLQEEAKQRFGVEVLRVGTLGSYSCRSVVGRLRARHNAHASCVAPRFTDSSSVFARCRASRCVLLEGHRQRRRACRRREVVGRALR